MVLLPADQELAEIKAQPCSKETLQKGTAPPSTDPIDKLIERIKKLVQEVEKNNRLLYSSNLLQEFRAREKPTPKRVGKSRNQPPFKWMTS